ncbi:hypothetical protein AVEN_260220-1 [Araneus ventricosus]|uniref:Uncharacterized protein n=1 Tax=Araneus ventricosus TaxID=182803 RepID=A0A4Y2TBB5_ARAVE|nr:hypothetical protein AVEN_260220-1 [Araneus ventricosus]
MTGSTLLREFGSSQTGDRIDLLDLVPVGQGLPPPDSWEVSPWEDCAVITHLMTGDFMDEIAGDGDLEPDLVPLVVKAVIHLHLITKVYLLRRIARLVMAAMTDLSCEYASRGAGHSKNKPCVNLMNRC